MAIYIVFDVETPNSANNRMSAIGISAIKDNKIVANYFSLVDPETHFDYFNTQLTGIDSEKVKDAPNFAELWKKIEPIMSKGILVAHNAVFDMGVLRSCLQSYGITWKTSAEYLCTVQIGRSSFLTAYKKAPSRAIRSFLCYFFLLKNCRFQPLFGTYINFSPNIITFCVSLFQSNIAINQQFKVRFSRKFPNFC